MGLGCKIYQITKNFEFVKTDPILEEVPSMLKYSLHPGNGHNVFTNIKYLDAIAIEPRLSNIKSIIPDDWWCVFVKVSDVREFIKLAPKECAKAAILLMADDDNVFMVVGEEADSTDWFTPSITVSTAKDNWFDSQSENANVINLYKYDERMSARVILDKDILRFQLLDGASVVYAANVDAKNEDHPLDDYMVDDLGSGITSDGKYYLSLVVMRGEIEYREIALIYDGKKVYEFEFGRWNDSETSSYYVYSEKDQDFELFRPQLPSGY